MVNRVIGIDPSLTSTAYCILGYDEPIISRIRTGNMRGMQRIISIEQNLRTLIQSSGTSLVLIEGYSYASINQAHQAGELGGVLRRMFYLANIPWVAVAPTTLKKFATGSGRADKNQVMLQVYKRWGIEAKNDDEADAYVLAKIGTYLQWADEGELTKPQREALETVKAKMEEA